MVGYDIGGPLFCARTREANTVGVVSLCAERHGHPDTEDGGRTQGPAEDVEGTKADKGREEGMSFLSEKSEEQSSILEQRHSRKLS